MIDFSKGVRAISLHEYWAALVMVDAKRIETRDWQTTYRGALAIQAAKKIPNYAKDSFMQSPSAREVLLRKFGIRRKDELCMLPVGSIVAVCNLVDMIKVRSDNPNLIPIPDKFKTDGWEEFGNYARGRYLWLLDDIQALTSPIPCRGYQGLWNLSDDVISQIQAQLAPNRPGLPQPETSFNEPVESGNAFEKAIQGAPPFERSLLEGQWKE